MYQSKCLFLKRVKIPFLHNMLKQHLQQKLLQKLSPQQIQFIKLLSQFVGLYLFPLISLYFYSLIDRESTYKEN